MSEFGTFGHPRSVHLLGVLFCEIDDLDSG